MAKGRIMRAFHAYLQYAEYPIMTTRQKDQIVTVVSTPDGYWVCQMVAREVVEQAFVYALFSRRVPKERIPAVLEYITRANCEPAQGTGIFELDLDEGKISFRTSLDVMGIDLTPHVIHRLVHGAVCGFDLHADGLFPVMFGEIRPLEALNRVFRYDMTEIMVSANDEMDDDTSDDTDEDDD